MPDAIATTSKLLQDRIEHLKKEEERNKRSSYATICQWRRLEVEYLLAELRKMWRTASDNPARN